MTWKMLEIGKSGNFFSEMNCCLLANMIISISVTVFEVIFEIFKSLQKVTLMQAFWSQFDDQS